MRAILLVLVVLAVGCESPPRELGEVASCEEMAATWCHNLVQCGVVTAGYVRLDEAERLCVETWERNCSSGFLPEALSARACLEPLDELPCYAFSNMGGAFDDVQPEFPVSACHAAP